MPYSNKMDLLLERYVLGELSEEKMLEVAALETGDPEIRAQIEKIKKDNSIFLEKYPAEHFVHRLDTGAEVNKAPERKSGSWFFRFAVPVFAVALIVMFLPQNELKKTTEGEFYNPATNEVTRTKGDMKQLNADNPLISVYRKTFRGTEEVQNGDLASEGDRLQLAYHAGTMAHGVIISVDGNSVVTFHHPGQINGDTRLKKGRQVLLSSSYELDDAPDFERFFLISSDSKSNIDMLLKNIEELKERADIIEDKDELFKKFNCHCSSLIIKKR